MPYQYVAPNTTAAEVKKKFEPEEFTEKIRKWGLLLLVLLVVGYGVYRLLAAILGG